VLLLGIVVSVLAAPIVTRGAEPGAELTPDTLYGAFLPWVANGVNLDAGVRIHSDIVIQNLEPVSIEIDVHVGLGESGTVIRVEEYQLDAHASIRISASELEIPSGEGASVLVLGRFTEVPVHLESALPDGLDREARDEILNRMPARISAIARSSSPEPLTNGGSGTQHVSIDGYSALTAGQLSSDSQTWILPVVQRNNGWETILRLSAFGAVEDGTRSSSDVVLTFRGSGSDGFANDRWEHTLELAPGETESLEISEIVPDGFVGSVSIEYDGLIGAIAERYKTEDHMLLTNVSRPLAHDQTLQYAPLIFRQYHDWNTGISVANTDDENWNTVTISYYAPGRSRVGEERLTIPPGGMDYIYTPGGDWMALDGQFVGSARISGTTGYHAAIDQVKYRSTEQDRGQAMSYVLEDRIGHFHRRVPSPALSGEINQGDVLALPLIQKGDSDTGYGDSTGIQLFNTSLTNAVNLSVMFYDEHGQPAVPSMYGGSASPMLVTLAPSQSNTIYTFDLAGIPDGFRGSVALEVISGSGGVVGISNSVNYEVDGDGSAAFSAVLIAPAYLVLEAVICEASAEHCLTD
jgi:hypothetical protein